MSGPNGDPIIAMDEGIINDEDDFGDGGNELLFSLILIYDANVIQMESPYNNNTNNNDDTLCIYE